ncbi:uncharacterized protein CCDC197 isoform X2 [Crotalus tigris]|uniref:uncharacterized protein CCDC197 isoform X2 n=1 Tax=Crotalus tigris TaxID=88082 RepID=UPI00192F527C|nr:uncharacterized protein CCDC197 isoform X2 [Crotalus tigris]
MKEDSERVTRVPILASSEVLHPSRKTMQQFRLLKKKTKDDIITAELIAKKQDIKMRMERVAQCREELQQKDQNNRTQAYGFQIYLQECDLKKEHPVAKYKIEQKNNALKRQKIHTLKREIQKLKFRQHELQKKIAKYKCYGYFLKKIVNMLPPDFWGYQEDAVIKTLTQRHKTLFSINQKLKNHLFSQEENIETIHHKSAAIQEEHNTMRFVLISKVSELQSKCNALKERNIHLINYIDNKEGLISQYTRELSRMLVGISNMAERCYMKHYGPLEQMSFQSKLDMIQEFICEKTVMKQEIMKPEEYKSSSSLLKR